MNWLLSLFGITEPEPLEENEVVDEITELLEKHEEGELECDDYEALAKMVLEVTKKQRNPRQVTRSARESIEKLKTLVPKDDVSIVDVDELSSKVKVTFTSARGVAVEFHSRSKSAVSIEDLLDDTLEILGDRVRIS